MRFVRALAAHTVSSLAVLALLAGPCRAASTSPIDPVLYGASAPMSIGGAVSSSMLEIVRAKAAGSMALAASDTAYFAGGSFWALEASFQERRGVTAVTTGFVKLGKAPLETIEVVFDPRIVSYEMLLDHYWHNVDPTRDDGQLCEEGPRYRAVIFVRSEAQKRSALASREALAARGGFELPIATEIAGPPAFERAGNEDQDVYRRQRSLYRDYLEGCDRAARLAEIWNGRQAAFTSAE